MKLIEEVSYRFILERAHLRMQFEIYGEILDKTMRA